ncbi:hypothetical protein RsoM2USA_177 [Ralstonia phage RsoM2USA]|nr:hypothetical protein RsoM2USA_177 [Ralstonia phage RsoM2USA]
MEKKKAPKKKTYYSSYQVDGKTYSTFIVANSKKRAEDLAEIRGIGEIIDGSLLSNKRPIKDLPSTKFKSGDYLSCLHGLIFFSWIAVSARAIHVDDAMADTGVVHEMMHFVQFKGEDGILGEDEMLKRIQSFERKVPGLT